MHPPAALPPHASHASVSSRLHSLGQPKTHHSSANGHRHWQLHPSSGWALNSAASWMHELSYPYPSPASLRSLSTAHSCGANAGRTHRPSSTSHTSAILLCRVSARLAADGAAPCLCWLPTATGRVTFLQSTARVASSRRSVSTCVSRSTWGQISWWMLMELPSTFRQWTSARVHIKTRAWRSSRCSSRYPPLPLTHTPVIRIDLLHSTGSA